MTLDETRFATLADETLRRMMETIDAQASDTLEADLRDGILTIEIETGGQYIVNKHGPNREIWVSSPKSGAWHFAYDEEKRSWVDTRGRGGEAPMTLHRLMERELSAATHTNVTLANAMPGDGA
jgi:frataxin